MEPKIKLLSGTANRQLAEEVSEHLGIPLTPVEVKRFQDGELYCRVLESVRGNTIFVIQPTCPPTNENLMELLVLVDALKRASAKEINAVIPYYGYSRQDRKMKSREPISGRLVANMLQAAGVHRVITFDLHAGQSQGFFDIPMDNLEVVPLTAKYFLNKKLESITVVSPDVGGSVRAGKFANIIDAKLAIIDKRRPEPGKAKILHVIGDVKDRTCILFDDMIDSGGTMAAAADKIKELGAKEVYVAATHPVFSGEALKQLQRKSIAEVVVTNTIPVKEKGNLKVISVGKLLADSLQKIYEAEPMGVMFHAMYDKLKEKHE